MSNEVATQTATKQEMLVVHDNGEFSNLMDSARFNQMWRVAVAFSKSKMIPQHFQGEPESVFVILQMAFRMGIDPMLLLQGTYMVHGRPGMEAKLIIALVNARGPFTGPISWRLEGSGENRKCTAYATHKETGQICEAEVTWEMVKKEGWASKNGSKWLTLPDLMFKYRSATFLARLYAPEVIFGLSTVDEIEDFTDRPYTQIITQDTVTETKIPEIETGPTFSALVLAKNLKSKTMNLLDEFVAATAKALSMDIDTLKAEAARNFDTFWENFRVWAKKQKDKESAQAPLQPDQPQTNSNSPTQAESTATGQPEPQNGNGDLAARRYAEIMALLTKNPSEVPDRLEESSNILSPEQIQEISLALDRAMAGA
jgi:hypothetical protein